MTNAVITLVRIRRTWYLERICWALATFAAAVNAVQGRDWVKRIEAECPAAAAEEAQLLSAKPSPKDEPSVSRPALREELLQMETLDQDVREALTMGDLPSDDPALLHIRDVDTVNLRKLKHIVNQDGFPTVQMVGLAGVNAAFILTQHADPQFQAKMLPILSARFKQGEISGQDYGLLTDRVLRAQGKAQRYGSQFTWTDGSLKPDPIADEAHVDQRRHALGMISMANYSCVLSAMYDSPRP
jgi:hypothetical protein